MNLDNGELSFAVRFSERMRVLEKTVRELAMKKVYKFLSDGMEFTLNIEFI